MPKLLANLHGTEVPASLATGSRATRTWVDVIRSRGFCGAVSVHTADTVARLTRQARPGWIGAIGLSSGRFLKFRPKWRISRLPCLVDALLGAMQPWAIWARLNQRAALHAARQLKRPPRKTVSPAEPSRSAGRGQSEGRLEFELDFFVRCGRRRLLSACRQRANPAHRSSAQPREPAPRERSLALAYRSLAKSGALPSPSSLSIRLRVVLPLLPPPTSRPSPSSEVPDPL
ncbi:hypothetical protein L1887_58269 [Cichorium endivia]|nr:hypothetical protein L1887_58269 [Cichorium endivia]